MAQSFPLLRTNIHVPISCNVPIALFIPVIITTKSPRLSTLIFKRGGKKPQTTDAYLINHQSINLLKKEFFIHHTETKNMAKDDVILLQVTSSHSVVFTLYFGDRQRFMVAHMKLRFSIFVKEKKKKHTTTMAYACIMFSDSKGPKTILQHLCF